MQSSGSEGLEVLTCRQKHLDVLSHRSSVPAFGCVAVLDSNSHSDILKAEKNRCMQLTSCLTDISSLLSALQLLTHHEHFNGIDVCIGSVTDLVSRGGSPATFLRSSHQESGYCL
jgi:hypothetical protein